MPIPWTCCCNSSLSEICAVTYYSTKILSGSGGPGTITRHRYWLRMLNASTGETLWTRNFYEQVGSGVIVPVPRTGLAINGWAETLTSNGKFYNKSGYHTRTLNGVGASVTGTDILTWGIHDVCFDVNNLIYLRERSAHLTPTSGTMNLSALRFRPDGQTRDRFWLPTQTGTWANAANFITPTIALVDPNIPELGIYCSGTANYTATGPSRAGSEWLWKFRNTATDKTQEWVEDDTVLGSAGIFLKQANNWVRSTLVNGDAVAAIDNEGYAFTGGGISSSKGAVVIYSNGGGVLQTIEVYDAPFTVRADGEPSRVEIGAGGDIYAFTTATEIVKIDSSGLPVWTLGGVGTPRAFVADHLDTGDLFVIRGASPGFFVERLRNSDGASIWVSDLLADQDADPVFSSDAIAYRNMG